MIRRRSTRRWAGTTASLAVAVALAVTGAVSVAATSPGPREHTATLGEVIDGDTLAFRDGTRVRLIGIDTPETHNPDFGVECYGRAATHFVERLLRPGERLRIVLDVETHDRYDRLLAYVYRARDGLFVNATIVRRGYAYVATIPPNVAHAEQFRRLAAQARRAQRGLWSACDVQGAAGGERPPPESDDGCLPQYHGACVPPAPPDYDCVDFDGPITITGDDPHHLDGNSDGVACEEPG